MSETTVIDVLMPTGGPMTELRSKLAFIEFVTGLLGDDCEFCFRGQTRKINDRTVAHWEFSNAKEAILVALAWPDCLVDAS